VRPYSDSTLFELLSGSRLGPDGVSRHRQAQYLAGYLGDIAGATIVAEYDYVDGDYLADFASFYVSCFEPYERFCKRLHFFNVGFDENHLKRVMLNLCTPEERQTFADAYLGFVVVRPLPDSVVGRTALKPYPPDGHRRNYTALVQYNVSLYGIELTVRSLAYQEQDTVMAACATVAIWSALHRTASLYGTRAPRPPVITADATRTLLYQRALPSTGLRLEQMMAAIRAADLDPEAYEPATASIIRPLASLIYAYSRGGLPVILVENIEGLGQHAITIAGYSLLKERAFQREIPEAFYVQDADGTSTLDATGRRKVITVPTCPPLVGLRIDEFYAHDDGVGPFSRLKVKQPDAGAHITGEETWRTTFEGQWLYPDGTARAILPTCVIVPVYQKIRLHFDVVLSWVRRLHPVLFSCSLAPIDRVEWDIFICETNDYKHDVAGFALHDDRKSGLLLSSQPRFIWRLAFSLDGDPKAEFLLDATSFSKAFPVFAVNWFDAALASRVEAVVQTGQVTALLSVPLETLLLAEIRQRETSIVGSPSLT
jgi:hypothetical protein